MRKTTTSMRRARIAALAISACIAAAFATIESAQSQTAAAPAADGKKPPTGCPPLPETGTGPSSIKVTGPCAFEHKGEADCEAPGDDFLVTVTRKGRNGTEVMFYINVERYVGPGKYRAPNDIWVSLKEGSNIYRWYARDFVATVGPDSRSVTVKDVRLAPELLLVGCTGPQTNFQCDGRGDDPKHMETLTTVTGTIMCKGTVKHTS